MYDLIKIISEEAKKYPLMTAQDYVKLIYQNEFGCGHFVSDEKVSLDRIKKEISESGEKNVNFENIGGGYARLFLGKNAEKIISAEIINKMFLMSAEKSGSLEAFKEKLKLFWEICLNGDIKIDLEEAKKYLSDYEKQGFPMVSHSEQFKNAYNPAYRVVKNQFSVYFEVICAVNKLINEKERVILAIDGRCSSGKSTLAKVLAELFDGEVVSADDFFLPFEKRSADRMSECGGNIDYERLKTEVIDNLRLPNGFSYGVFSCKSGKIKDKKHISPKQLIIVEGSYSCHDYFGEPYDLKVFLTVDEKIQRERILNRNGEKMLQMFENMWIPMEEKYFNGQKTREKCDLIINTEEL